MDSGFPTVVVLDTCCLHLPFLWALGLARGALCFQDADLAAPAGQAVFNPSFVSPPAGVRVHPRGGNLGYVIKLHAWHGDLVLMHVSHVLAFPGHCPRPRPVD